ncbi:MAG: EAL domain-containing protein [Alphaproteobacteria bacterium]|nr:EAL domain-containing protein [Alphaproteobacteria bacterium]
MTTAEHAPTLRAFDDAEEAFGDFELGCATVDFGVLTRVKEAIAAGRIDLYLQPIVALPSTQPKFFEAFSRLRDAEGAVLAPVSYIEAAERAHRIGVIDNLILTRCIDAIRRRGRIDPDLTVFCNISPATLFDSEFFDQFTAYLESHDDLASRLVFEFTLPSIHMMHPRVERNIEEIAERGFAFSVDHVHSFDFDWDSLRARNFRYVKMSRRMLYGARSSRPSRERLAELRDMRNRLADSGIEVIAEKIELAGDLAAIQSSGIRYAQGHFFGAPRPADFYLHELTAVGATPGS